MQHLKSYHTSSTFIIFQLLTIDTNKKKHSKSCTRLYLLRWNQSPKRWTGKKADLLLNPVLLMHRREKPSRDKLDRADPVYLHGSFSVPNNQHGKDDHKLKLPQQRARRKVCCYRAYSVSFSKASDIIRKTAWWRWKTLHLLPVNWAQRQHFLVFEVYSLKRNAKEVKWEAENNIKDVNSAVLSKT